MAITESEIQSIKQRFGIIGNSPLLNNSVRVAMQVAPTDMSVLITGESGSGKESFSKIIGESLRHVCGSKIRVVVKLRNTDRLRCCRGTCHGILYTGNTA